MARRDDVEIVMKYTVKIRIQEVVVEEKGRREILYRRPLMVFHVFVLPEAVFLLKKIMCQHLIRVVLILKVIIDVFDDG